MSHTVFRQRLTHFLKILEIFKIPNFFGELCQNLQFLAKNIFGVTLILYRYRVSTDLCLLNSFVTLLRKKLFKMSPKFINKPNNFEKMQVEIGKPKNDAFFKF